MNPEAATLEPPPSAPTPPPVAPAAKAVPGMAEAAKAHAEFERTGKKPEATPPAAPAKKEPAAPAKKEPEQKPAPAEKSAGAIGDIKPKPEPVKKEPPAKELPKKTDEETHDNAPQTRWQQLKAAEAELNELKPKWDATQKEKAEWEKERTELAAERKELEQLRKERDFTDVTKSKRYIEEVDTPFNEIQDQVQEVADYGKMDIRALMTIMKEPNSMVRAKKLAEYIETNSKETIPPAQITELSLAGSKLKGIFAKMEEFHEQATQEKEQHENHQKAEKLRVETETKQIRENALKEATSILKTNASDVIPEDVLNTAIERSQKRRNEPMDDAFRDVSEFLVPSLIETVRERDATIAELREELEAAEGAKPGIKPEKDKTTGKQAPYSSLQEATAAHKAAGAHL